MKHFSAGMNRALALALCSAFMSLSWFTWVMRSQHHLFWYLTLNIDSCHLVLFILVQVSLGLIALKKEKMESWEMVGVKVK